MTTIREQLLNARQSRKISQRELGREMGIPQSHVSQIESGNVDPRLSSILEMARLLELEVIVVPRSILPVIRGLVEGKPDDPLWQADESEKDE